ncbi:MAG: hypothetical protein AAGA25_12190 [Planctomycetota bacterium]
MNLTISEGPRLDTITPKSWRKRYDQPFWINATRFNGHGQGRLPMVPRPLGFTVNTLFYAVVACLLFHLTRYLGRRLRQSDHPACPACGYNLTGLPTDKPCPECGHART